MAFVALTNAYVTIVGAKSGRRENISITKASAVGMVTFSKNSQTFLPVNEDFYIADAYTGDSVNNADYLELYSNNMPTTRRIPGGIFKTAPTGANRIMDGPVLAGPIQFYWYSA